MTQPKVLLFEKIHKKGMEFLQGEGCEIIFPHSTDEAALLEIVPQVSGIVFRTRGIVSRRLLEAAPNLRVVGRHGVGLDNVDVDAATEMGVWVVSTPEANSESVGEHFLAFVLMLSKKIPQSMRALVTGPWEARNSFVGQEFFGKTLGIVGLGRVGSTIARMCHRAFGTKILFRDIVPKPEWEKTIGAEPVSLERLLQESDYVSLNVPLTKLTRGMIGAKELSLMKSTAFIINTSRGPVWKEADLHKALADGWIAGAAADVFEHEPTALDNPLLRLDNFLATPHVAAHTVEAMQRMAMVVEDVVAVIQGKAPKHPANQPRFSRKVTLIPSGDLGGQ